MTAWLVFVTVLLGALKGTSPTTYCHGAVEISQTACQQAMQLVSELLPIAGLALLFESQFHFFIQQDGKQSMFTHPTVTKTLR
jgi:hypothetical protein